MKNRLVDHLERCGLLTDFCFGFSSCQSTAGLSKVASEGTNKSGTTTAVKIDIFKAFVRVWQAILLFRLKSHGSFDQFFELTLSFLSNRRLQVVLDGTPFQEYPVNAGVPQGSILCLKPFLLYINELPDYVKQHFYKQHQAQMSKKSSKN